MITYTTAYSIYEVDEVHQRIRRTLGVNQPTPRQGNDGEWQDYYDVVVAPDGLLIFWDDKGRCTLTSQIVNEEET